MTSERKPSGPHWNQQGMEYWWSTPRARLLTYNRQFAEMWAIPESILRSYDHKSAVKFVAPQLKDPDAFVNKIRQANTDHEAHIDDVLEAPGWTHLRAALETPASQGKSVGRVWAFRDVTGHRRAAVALREATDRLNLALKSAQAGTWSWSPDQKILRWDNQVSALYGLEPDAWENNYYEHFTILHPDDRSAAAERMARSIREGLLFECEFGSLGPMEVFTWSPTEEKCGGIRGVKQPA